jgi:oligopeptide/dipeptide ABC transporter ATP-binding protein
MLEVQDLSVTFQTDGKEVSAVDKVSFTVHPGKTLGIVGESGCGKSVTCLAIMRLLPQPIGRIMHGKVLLGLTDLVSLPRELLQEIRGKRIAMIFQEPMTALNPVETIGNQLTEVFTLHFPTMTLEEKLNASLDLLSQVGISSPKQRMNSYPHELSGGMRQRAMIAMALACKPDILIADEPTTALDVTIQAQVLSLLKSIQQNTGMAMIFITHDLGVVAEVCDEVLVMYGGRAVETGTVEEIFSNPAHPYTRGLLNSLPKLIQQPKSKLETIPGIVPALNAMPSGCRFQARCSHTIDTCKSTGHQAIAISNSHKTWCVRYNELKGKL